MKRPHQSIFSKPDPEEEPLQNYTDRNLEEIAARDSAAPRPPMREAKSSSVERAKTRAKQVREHITSMDEGIDEFFIDPAVIPEGWGYEWKTQFVMGKEEPAYAVALARKGWEPVPASRHPELMPRGSKDVYVTRKGMILMERPQELIDEARAIEARRAKLQVRNKEEQLSAAPAGQFERSNKDEPLTKLRKSFEAMPIPE